MTVHTGVAAILVTSGILTSAPVPAQRAATSAPRTHAIFLAAFKDGEGRTLRLAFLGIQMHGFTVDKPRNITNHAGDDDTLFPAGLERRAFFVEPRRQAARHLPV